MSKTALVTDDDLARSRTDPVFRHQLLADNLEMLLDEIKRLRRGKPDEQKVKQIREGVDLAVQLAEILQRRAHPGGRAGQADA
jgi:hypothetical protein